MLSPYTGKEMKVVYEPRTWIFRGEEYEYIHTAYRCEDTGELFTTCESDDASFMQVANQYRAKHGIPFVDEIIAVRSRYGVSAAKMSAILGIGTNQWRLYEGGEVPSVSNGRMIRSIMNPKVFLDLVESIRQQLTDKEYANIAEKVQKVIAQSKDYHLDAYECRRVFSSIRGADNGYSSTSLPKLKAIMLMVLQECGEVFCTKMNKLLFYIDFLSYRQRGYAMSGLSYRAIDFGPVPDRFPALRPARLLWGGGLRHRCLLCHRDLYLRGASISRKGSDFLRCSQGEESLFHNFCRQIRCRFL